MKNKKALALALASLTMASAAVLTSYSATTASPVSAEEVVYRTEWVTVINGRSQKRKTVFYEDGNQPISKHSTIEGFEFQRAYVEGGRKYYLFVEKGTKEQIFSNPQHPYTKALMSAVPIPDPKLERNKSIELLEGELPSPINPPSGCVFRTRCLKADENCAKQKPPFTSQNNSHFVACLKVL